jgi:hypothetical protein
MSSLFSSFTLYEPYLSIMYDPQQSFQLFRHASYSYLKKDIQTIQTKKPKNDWCWKFWDI